MDDIALDFDPRNAWFNTNVAFAQIGRASCRERVSSPV